MEINIQEPREGELIGEKKRSRRVSVGELYRRDPVLFC